MPGNNFGFLQAFTQIGQMECGHSVSPQTNSFVVSIYAADVFAHHALLLITSC